MSEETSTLSLLRRAGDGPVMLEQAEPLLRDSRAIINSTAFQPHHGARLRILLTSYRSNPHSGGQGVYIRHISKALTDIGHQVDVISGPPYPELDPRIGLIKLPSLDLFAHPKPLYGLPKGRRGNRADWIEYLSHTTGGFSEPYAFGRRLVDYLRTRCNAYDIIHDNQTLCTGLLELQRLGPPVISTIHHPITKDRDHAIAAQETRLYKFLVWRWHLFLNMQKRVARRLDNIIAVSHSTYGDLIDEFGLRPEQMQVILEGIDSESFRPMPEIKRKPNRLMATASADVPLKGLVHLVEAYANLLPEFPDLELVVVGKLREGPAGQLLLNLGVKDRVQFVSGISNEELCRLYAAATIAVCPSLYEGFGFPAGEAMAAGVPLVTTSGGALPEVAGQDCVMTPPGDSGALAAAIAGLLRDPGRRAALSISGRARMVREFQWSRTAAELTAYYHQKIEQHAHRRS